MPPGRPRICPLSPYTPKSGMHHATPDSDKDSGNKLVIFLSLVPKGHQLVIGGCIPNIPSKTPIILVKDLLTNLASELGCKYFQDLPIIVSLFSNRPNSTFLAGYVELKFSGGDVLLESRVDLLDNVRTAIMKAKPNWEGRWSTSRKGKGDTHLSCCSLNLYPRVKTQDNIPSEHLPIL
ncbi:hypothetical protein C0989_011305 [Termitomyces sp. Mn162]|nr:hypothetical protein C0989_011305 [Termitomyces sp. Mn162]